MNKLFKNTLVYSIGRIIPQLTGFILLPIYTKYMKPEEYGIVQSMQILGIVLVVFFSLASERSIFRLFYDYNKTNETKIFFGNLVFLIFFTSLTLYGLIFVFQDPFSRIFNSIEFYPFYFLAITNTLFLTFSFVPLNMYQVQGKALIFTLLSVVSFLVGVLFILYFVVLKEEKAIGMLKGQMIGNGLMLFFYVPIILNNAEFKIKKKVLKNIFQFSIPMIPALLSAWILNMSNRVMLDIFIKDPNAALKEIGIYSLAFKIASSSAVVLGAFSTAYNPIFFEKANQQDQIKSKKELGRLNFIYAIVSFSICFTISFFSKEVITILFDKDYHEAFKIIPIITLSVFFTQIISLFNLMNYQEKKTVAVMLIIVSSAVITLVSNVLLIPVYFSIGAAWANVFGVVINLTLAWYYAKRHYYVPFNLMKILFFALIGVCIIYIDFLIDFNDMYISLLLKVVLIGSVLFFLYRKYKTEIFQILKKQT